MEDARSDLLRLRLPAPLAAPLGTGPEATAPLAEFVGASPAAAAVRRALGAAARVDSTLLVTGETGTGKGLVARLVHRLSERAARPFVHVDCAALSSGVVESELFGHERGAFTGALERRAGRLEWAGEGTLFLDEVGELEPPLQAKLLRALQDREFERVGGTQTLTLRARVVAATNRDLAREVREGRFRRDLYFRLRVLSIEVPPLRERLEDLHVLAEAGLRRLRARLGPGAPHLEEEILARLLRHPWPGNVRELWNALERLAVCAADGIPASDLVEAILDDALDAAPEAQPAAGPDAALPADPRDPADLPDERSRLAAVLVATGGNLSRAARRLGLARSTLRHAVRRHGLGGLVPRD
jgi:transcriptional regulator with GAF, ATPase, and Fis domain